MNSYIRCCKLYSHSNTITANSAAGVLPSWATPPNNRREVFSNQREFLIDSDGSVGSNASVAVTDTNLPVQTTFILDD